MEIHTGDSSNTYFMQGTNNLRQKMVKVLLSPNLFLLHKVDD